MFDLYIELGERILEDLGKYRIIAAKVKDIVLRHHKNARVYVFGSVLSGKITASSDIDILVVAELTNEEKEKLKADILREIGFSPVEIHVATEEELKRWYLKFIDRIEEV
ncbi:nucleotidyltransferase domain-containing protein [Candidatus Methanodesulfokora washburnensis]|jgi:predicted nucleotidyltransferase|uniref:Nucleotidyltransferase domain-containing protein n=1 Tax=Candidatus Methanodesulfokora washburnensis TaxID=2478471 RepID=A0A429GL61_9CREN|nr:nucleotidyltransferase domain-containing protein [Candidatus Methanodesulfokores washburnensis]RSN74575.1 nucleotidyltransferase domain-containing protein [Candidatus Methanodesulfokores washburnensis]